MFKRLLSRAALCLLSLALASGAGLAQAQTQAIEPTATASAAAAPAPAVATEASAVTPPSNLGAAAVTPPAGDASDNPYGLHAVWAQGDLVAKTTLLLLAIMSLLSWYLIVAKLLEQRRLNAQALAAKKAFSGSDNFQKRAETLPPSSPFRFIVDSALEAARRHHSLSGQVDMNAWLSQDIVQSVGSLQMRSQEGLSVLATVGSTAPFVGLFGTVWGIYNALVTIGISGQASIDKVAGPVGEALIMTALGLAVAVPAVLGYNWLVRRNRVALHAARGFGSELHTLLLIEIEKSQRAATPARSA